MHALTDIILRAHNKASLDDQVRINAQLLALHRHHPIFHLMTHNPFSAKNGNRPGLNEYATKVGIGKDGHAWASFLSALINSPMAALAKFAATLWPPASDRNLS